MSGKQTSPEIDWSLAEIEVRAVLLKDVFSRLESILMIHCKGGLLILSEPIDAAYIRLRGATEQILASDGFERLLEAYPKGVIPKSLHSMGEDADIDFELTIQREMNRFTGEMLEFCLNVNAGYGDLEEYFRSQILIPWDELIESFRKQKKDEEKDFFRRVESQASKFKQQTEAKTNSSGGYVEAERIGELRAITSASFDLSKLIKLCEELNQTYSIGCWLAVAMLVRSILDHVPPVFSCKSFSEVANNYAGSKSFRQSMAHLENSSRKIADAHLHTQIRKTESLPNKTQVNFTNDLDVLLAEIARILR